MDTVVYDPAEIVLVTKSPYVGLKLGQRETAVDIIAMAQSELVLNPEAARLEKIIKDDPTVSDDLAYEMMRDGKVSLDFLFYLQKAVPLVRYKGVLKIGQDEYRFNYFLARDCEYEITKGWIDYIIANREYDWSIMLDGDKVYFDADLVKHRIVDPGCEIKYVDTVSQYRIEGGNDGLHMPLRELSEKYPQGRRIDPVVFTSEFLDLLKE